MAAKPTSKFSLEDQARNPTAEEILLLRAIAPSLAKKYETLLDLYQLDEPDEDVRAPVFTNAEDKFSKGVTLLTERNQRLLAVELAEQVLPFWDAGMVGAHHFLLRNLLSLAAKYARGEVGKRELHKASEHVRLTWIDGLYQKWQDWCRKGEASSSVLETLRQALVSCLSATNSKNPSAFLPIDTARTIVFCANRSENTKVLRPFGVPQPLSTNPKTFNFQGPVWDDRRKVMLQGGLLRLLRYLKQEAKEEEAYQAKRAKKAPKGTVGAKEDSMITQAEAEKIADLVMVGIGLREAQQRITGINVLTPLGWAQNIEIRHAISRRGGDPNITPVFAAFVIAHGSEVGRQAVLSNPALELLMLESPELAWLVRGQRSSKEGK